MNYNQKLNPCLLPFYDRAGYGFIANMDKKGDFKKDSFLIEDILRGQSLINSSAELKNDTYYNIGIFRNGKHANMENLLQVTELYCDIDNHLTGGFTLQKAQSFIDQIDKYFDVEIPRPTRIDFTGRGIQIHWHLKECYDMAKWRIVQEGLQTLLDSIFEKESVLCVANSLKLDRLTNQNRYLRAPDTYNTKGQTLSHTLYEERKQYEINDIIRKYEIPIPKDGKRRGVKSAKELADIKQKDVLGATTQQKQSWSKTEKWYEYRLVNEKRLSDLFKIQQLRNDRGYVEGYRSMMIREYCHIVKKLYPGDTKAQKERVYAFNDGFTKPLKQSEIEAWLRATWNSKEYRQHTNNTIISVLDISLSEMESLETIVTKQVKNARYYQANKERLKELDRQRYQATKQKKRAERKERIKQAQALYLKGKTVREIAKSLNIGLATVSRYINLR